MRWTLTLPISDRSSPDSIKLGEWLFRRRTLLPLPIAAAILLLPSRQTSPNVAAILAGVALTAAGEGIRLWGVRHIGVISRTRSDRLGPLVESGPFEYVRNPLYIGNIAIWVGFSVAAGLVWLAPIVFALLAVEYHAIVRWEEQLLESRLGEPFRSYAGRVPRWIPKSRAKNFSGNSADSAVAFRWRGALFSERGTLIAIAAGYLLLWIKAHF
jgi:protein-S-isoprenylcysteine O-methyltransferase Ste14